MFYPFILVSWVFLNFAITKWFCRETCFVKVFLLSRSYNVVQTSSEMLSFLHRWKILLKVWVWYRCQKWRERYYHHAGEQSTFYQKVHIKRHRLRKEECFYNLCIATSSNLFDKDHIQDNVAHCKCATQDKWHVQQEGSWLRWIVTEQVKCK